MGSFISNKVDKLKWELYKFRTELLFDKGWNEGKIVRFDDELYSKMKDTYVTSFR